MLYNVKNARRHFAYHARVAAVAPAPSTPAPSTMPIFTSHKSSLNTILVYLLILVTVALVVYLSYGYFQGQEDSTSRPQSLQDIQRYVLAAHRDQGGRGANKVQRMRDHLANTIANAREGFANQGKGGGLRHRTVSSSNIMQDFLNDKGVKVLWLHHKSCIHCVRMKDAWRKTVEGCPDKVNLYSASNDDGKQWSQLCKKYDVSGFPSILLFKAGNASEPQEHRGSRDSSSILDAIRSLF